MGETDIEWADKVWNPTRGCSRVSSGCGDSNGGGCYAERLAFRFSGPGMPYEGLVRMTAHGPRWTGKMKLIHEKLDEPLHWRKPSRIFVNSMSDLFHENLTFEKIAEVFHVMTGEASASPAPRHTYMILTKRPERAIAFFHWAMSCGEAWGSPDEEPYRALCDLLTYQGLPSRVWIGVSVENQETADERIPLLLKIPTKVPWVSYEPSLGPVDIIKAEACAPPCGPPIMHIAWLVIGGESGPGARPFDLAWARSVLKQCREGGVPCFVKQLGAWPFDGAKWNHGGLAPLQLRKKGQKIKPWINLVDPKGGDIAEFPEDLRVREWPA